MTSKVRVGFIGVGLMGHGVAKNILESGHFPLTFLGNRNRGPVDDLIPLGRHGDELADVASVAQPPPHALGLPERERALAGSDAQH